MRRAELSATASKEAEKWLSQVEKANELKRVQCIVLGGKGLGAKDIAVIVGFKKEESVRRIWKRYREEGQSMFQDKRGHNRGRAYWTKKEESQFLEQFKVKAESGEIVTISKIQEVHQKAMNKKISQTTTYNLLRRHGWRKIEPRPEHPKHNPEEVERFREAIFPPGYDPYESSFGSL